MQSGNGKGGKEAEECLTCKCPPARIMIEGKDSRAADKTAAMVLKEIPSKASSEGKPLLPVTTKLVSEQQESRPLLSPSIDDFLCETKCDGVSRPVTSNTAGTVH
ncbi:unnamed protein product [Pleuronectes platessa]|uniref:Uncharacterized protein n=1 Tax=Pleuronectes platessa TaxID=8262 RepID=A0A9N7YJR6_PLEPL|nr:unnamed protein product [Pleuronectes platessa]